MAVIASDMTAVFTRLIRITGWLAVRNSYRLPSRRRYFSDYPGKWIPQAYGVIIPNPLRRTSR
jgi:hypothetical protein